MSTFHLIFGPHHDNHKMGAIHEGKKLTKIGNGSDVLGWCPNIFGTSKTSVASFGVAI